MQLSNVSLHTYHLPPGVGHFDMFQVQAACLAGGVAMGALCSIKIGVWAAILVGVVAGIIVTWSQGYVVPFFNKSVRTIDARGVSSLHGTSLLCLFALPLFWTSLENEHSFAVSH